MEDINFVVSGNLKRLREERKFSLDVLAKLSGVSKSMLGQIERGEASPSISTVWKIANGFKVSFTELLMRPETDIEVVDKGSLSPLLDDGGRFRNFVVFPFDSTRGFEMFYIEIDPGSQLQADSHGDGAQEFLTVFSSELTITVEGEDLVISDGCSVRFKADCPHCYKNSGSEPCRLSMVISYPG